MHNTISHTYHNTLSRFKRNMRHLICFSLFFLCYTFPFKHAFISTHQLCPHDQMKALLEFKDMLTIDEYASEECNYAYPKTMSWNNKSGNNSDCCLWDGVTCDEETGHVIELDLSCSQLYGTISSNISDGLFHLTHLRRLNLAYNDFLGSHISPAFGRFTDLTHLNLSFSSFNGSIPRELSLLSKLVSIDVSSSQSTLYRSVDVSAFSFYVSNYIVSIEANDFDSLLKNLTHLREIVFQSVLISSSIPNSLMNLSSLEIVDLTYCDLDGILPGQIFMFPHLRELKLGGNRLFGNRGLLDSIGNLTSLRELDLSYTDLAGELPNSIGSMTSLTFIGLYNCNLSGSIPNSIGNLTELTLLLLSENNLSGSIPKSIENLKELTKLDLLANSLSGSIPKSIGNLTQLTELDLFYNSLSGSIPRSIGNLKELTYIDLSRNNLSGSIPRSIGNLKELTYIDLSRNNLSGSIPRSIGNLKELTYINLSYNSFHSQVPVTISNLKKLVFLSLHKNNLSGKLPPRLFTIPSLLFLDLGFNQLTGPIPDIQNGSSLNYIYLNNNSLQGSIPHSIVNLVNLTKLYLSSNKLNGTVEPLLFSKFEHLHVLELSRNFLQGSFPVLPVSLNTLSTSRNQLSGEFPSSICKLTSLYVLDLSYNDFGGEIPQCLVNCNNLEVLDLQKNRFSGTIPPIFADKLTTLNLNDNHFEGPIPESLSNCKKLELLDLGKNKLNGSFPHWSETFSELQVLVLHSNKFQGHVGTSKTISTYPKLRIFDLSVNEFTGILPARYFQNFTAMKNSKETGGPTYMEKSNFNSSAGSVFLYSTSVVWNGVEEKLERILTTLVTIDLSANNFEGQIPEALQELNSLRMLNLSNNSLRGSIPASLGNLSNLQYLDLSSNILTGTIPIQLARITTLARLNVSYNHLLGPIPQGRQFSTFENSSYIGNSGLCGFPLSNLCGDTKKPQSPKVTKQKKDHSIFSSGFTWKIVLFGYGCGVPFGLILGFLMFFVGWPRWFLGITEPQNGRPRRRRRNHT